MTCSVDDCNTPIYCRGYCQRHYCRWQKHGDPTICLKQMVPRGEPMKWLGKYATIVDDGPCLIWPFARSPNGRAHMRAGSPSRIMCEMVHGPAPSDEHQAAHSCGKACDGCVHPQHLRWATAKENSADAVAHGTLMFGEAHYRAKLTTADVTRIRELKGTMPQRTIASLFGVGITCINKILTGRRRMRA